MNIKNKNEHETNKKKNLKKYNYAGAKTKQNHVVIISISGTVNQETGG